MHIIDLSFHLQFVCLFSCFIVSSSVKDFLMLKSVLFIWTLWCSSNVNLKWPLLVLDWTWLQLHMKAHGFTYWTWTIYFISVFFSFKKSPFHSIISMLLHYKHHSAYWTSSVTFNSQNHLLCVCLCVF